MLAPAFHYVYILQSVSEPTRFYTGFTKDLNARLVHHNAGGDTHTAQYKPWKIKTAIAFTDRTRAMDFERYLKTAAGRAFAIKRL